MPRTLLLLLTYFAFALPASAQKRPMEIDDLFRFKRVADPQISPDGKLVVYQVTRSTSTRTNRRRSLARLDRRQSTATANHRHQEAIAIRAGRPMANASSSSRTAAARRNSGSSTSDGGEAKQITNISTGASNGIWSPDGTHVAFVSAVYPEFSEKPFEEADKLNKKKLEEVEKSPVKAKTFTRLFYRHWDELRRRQAAAPLRAQAALPKLTSRLLLRSRRGNRATSRPATATRIRPRRRSPWATTSPSARRQAPRLHRGPERTRRGARTTTSAACRSQASGSGKR